jgi:glycosyltransferase involved in cell wall biosynthesis
LTSVLDREGDIEVDIEKGSIGKDVLAEGVAEQPTQRASDNAIEPRPLCVLQVLPSLETGGGGVERSALDVAAALAAAGHKPIVASSGGALVHELNRASVEHVTMPLASKNPLTMRANVRRLRALVTENGVDIIHARSRAPAWSARAAARRTGAHFLTTFHGTYNFGSGIPGRLKQRYNAVMADGELVIANSHFIARHIQEHYGLPTDRIRVIPRGIDLDRFDPAKLRPEQIADAAERWQLEDGVPTIMLPGRLTRWKGQEVLIDAIAQTATRPLTCILVGADQGRSGYRQDLEARIKERGVDEIVRIVGHADDMPAAYMLADVVVSASTDPEAFGRVVAEGQAMGRPVVVANHGGAAEQVVEGETGWAFEPGNAADLAVKLDQALSLSTPVREIQAARSIAHVRGLYGKELMCRSTLGVYRELMAAT